MCAYMDKCLEYSYRLCWFSKLIITDSPPGSMTSLVLRSTSGLRGKKGKREMEITYYNIIIISKIKENGKSDDNDLLVLVIYYIEISLYLKPSICNNPRM